MTFQTTTVQQIIDRARIRHWSFRDLVLGDGAVLAYLSQRLRTHLAVHGAKIEGLVNTTLTYNVVNSGGLLIAEDPVTGIPQYTTTYQDGWPLHLDGNNVPYYDDAEPMIAADQYGLNGGTPGFPLPAEMVRLIDVSLVYSQPPGLIIPCDVTREHGRIEAQPGANPIAFVSGNRLVPLLSFSGTNGNPNASDRWMTVSSIIMSYVALPTLQVLTDYLNIPGVLVEALDADAALMMARQSKAMSAQDRSGFEKDASAAATVIASAALEMLNEPETGQVQYRG